MEKLTFLDFETTGFKENRAVSFALIHICDNKVVKKKYTLVHPMTEIEVGAYKIHKIGFAQIRNEKNFKQIWAEIREYIEGCKVIAHNVKYDLKVLLGELDRHDLECGEFQTICTCENAKRLITDSENHKLNTLCTYFNLTLDNHHNAKDDTIACKNIYYKLLELGELVEKKVAGRKKYDTDESVIDENQRHF
jgi:DNA polymerase-3 subunit epsilon